MRTFRPFLAAFFLLVFLVPASSVEASSRPACATSKKAKLTPAVSGDIDPGPRTFWVRACVKDGELSLEGHQRKIGSHKVYGRISNPDAEPSTAATIKVTVHSTSSNGRFLLDLVSEEVIEVGDLAPLFVKEIVRTATKGSWPVYGPSAVLPGVTLPDLAPGVYQASFEMVVDNPDDDRPSATTGVRYLKFKV